MPKILTYKNVKAIEMQLNDYNNLFLTFTNIGNQEFHSGFIKECRES